jgi:hypothetical protein
LDQPGLWSSYLPPPVYLGPQALITKSGLFIEIGSHFLPLLSLNHDSSTLCLLSGWDYISGQMSLLPIDFISLGYIPRNGVLDWILVLSSLGHCYVVFHNGQANLHPLNKVHGLSFLYIPPTLVLTFS